jgi:hypothetical protein
MKPELKPNTDPPLRVRALRLIDKAWSGYIRPGTVGTIGFHPNCPVTHLAVHFGGTITEAGKVSPIYIFCEPGIDVEVLPHGEK